MKLFKGIAIALVAAVISCVFCSCTDSFSESGALITAPTLFEEQDEIMRALKRSAGDKITLEYPRTGENRSAFILSDIDGDGENEAVAFYRNASDKLNQDIIHLNLLDNTEKNGWVSMCDIVGLASSIDRVSIAPFGDRKEIIVGWDVMTDREKTLVCYSLMSGNLIRDYTATYVEFAAADFWDDNEGFELITLNYSRAEENLTQPTQHARLIALSNKEFKVVSSVPLDSRVTGYKSCIAGRYNDKEIGYFIDGTIDAAFVNTQILTVSESGQILNPLLKADNKTDAQNVHKPSLLTQDVNGDGTYEVPHQEIVTGYETVPESEQIFKTIWKTLKDGSLEKSLTMYINSALGLRVMIPESLEGNITLRPIMAQNEVVFYEYKGSLESSNDPLFSIRVSQKELYEAQSGYEVLCSNEFVVVTVKLFNEENELCPTWERLFEMVDVM
ncbi:MAG: hypothetical protein IIX89_00230 [Oscillospiraceae bacterium]|nr:hypothetical protein [Oscillospiraceae bacterium]